MGLGHLMMVLWPASLLVFATPLGAFAILSTPQHGAAGTALRLRGGMSNGMTGQSKLSMGLQRFRRLMSTKLDSSSASSSEEANMADDIAALKASGPWKKIEALSILKFAGPALSIPLCDPIMSCVDAVCIGQFASTLDLAALGPNIVIFNFISYTFNFMSIATTLSVSKALADKDTKKAGRVISTAVWICTIAGIAMAMPLLVHGKTALAATGAVPELLEAGLQYLRIRILSCPAVLTTMVLQAGLLAQKDSFTPLLAVLISGGFNIVGDVVLINHYKMGIAGAAWATSAAQYVALMVLLVLGYARSKNGLSKIRIKSMPAEGKVYLSSAPPSKEELKPFLAAIGPLCFLSVSKNVCYLMLQSLATTFSTATCAAHQAMWSGWAILSFCGTPLEQAAQVFLPRYSTAELKFDLEHKKEAKKKLPLGVRKSTVFTRILIFVGTGVGLLLGLTGASIPYFPHFFSKDTALYPIMLSFSPFMFLSLLTAPISISLDGILMAVNDVTYLLKCQVLNMAVLASFLYWSHLSGSGILSVWYGVCLFFGLRLVQNLGRLYLRDTRASRAT